MARRTELVAERLQVPREGVVGAAGGPRRTPEDEDDLRGVDAVPTVVGQVDGLGGDDADMFRRLTKSVLHAVGRHVVVDLIDHLDLDAGAIRIQGEVPLCTCGSFIRLVEAACAYIDSLTLRERRTGQGEGKKHC